MGNLTWQAGAGDPKKPPCECYTSVVQTPWSERKLLQSSQARGWLFLEGHKRIYFFRRKIPHTAPPGRSQPLSLIKGPLSTHVVRISDPELPLPLAFLVLFPLLEWGVIVWALNITVCVSVFVSVLVCVCVCMHACICVLICVYAWVHAWVLLYSVCVCMLMCVCVHAFLSVCAYMHVHLCVCICAMCMCVCVCVWMCLVCLLHICLLCMFVYVWMCVGLCVCVLEVGCHKKWGQQQHE